MSGGDPRCEDLAALLAACAGGRAQPSLWPRLRARLAEEEAREWVTLRVPPLTWRAAAAMAAAVAVLAVVPEPLRFLAAFGML